MLDPWGEWAPMTFAGGYLRASFDRSVTALRTWTKQRVGQRCIEQPVTTPFPEVLKTLEPLVMIGRRRELLIECANGWTAYLDNSARGTDASESDEVGHDQDTSLLRGQATKCVESPLAVHFCECRLFDIDALGDRR